MTVRRWDTAPDRPNVHLLWCGLVAALLFVVSSVAQGLGRSGFDLDQQPISFLLLGDLGWLQRVTFLLAAALVVAFAYGLSRVPVEGASRRWAPGLVAGLGLGLGIAGLFPPDPGFGYPPSTPAGPPSHLTYTSTMHGIGFTVANVCFVLACAVFARRALRAGERTFAAYTCLTAVTVLVLALSPGNTGIAVRSLVAGVLLWCWIGVLAMRLIGRDRQRSGRRRRPLVSHRTNVSSP
jgi:Protein of unknown function (DUF998)